MALLLTHRVPRAALAMSAILALMTSQVASQTCQVDSINTQSNFNLDKYLGRWHEIQWVPPFFDDISSYWVDYSEVYSHDDGDMIDTVGIGKFPQDNQCGDYTKTYNVSSDRSKWAYDASKDGIDYIIDYWIIATDYNNYALCYGCTRRNSDGTCRNAHAWIWSRTTTLSADHRATIAGYYPALCLTANDFVDTSQTFDCKVPDAGGASQLAWNGGWTVILALVAMVTQFSQRH